MPFLRAQECAQFLSIRLKLEERTLHWGRGGGILARGKKWKRVRRKHNMSNREMRWAMSALELPWADNDTMGRIEVEGNDFITKPSFADAHAQPDVKWISRINSAIRHHLRVHTQLLPLLSTALRHLHPPPFPIRGPTLVPSNGWGKPHHAQRRWNSIRDL